MNGPAFGSCSLGLPIGEGFNGSVFVSFGQNVINYIIYLFQAGERGPLTYTEKWSTEPVVVGKVVDGTSGRGKVVDGTVAVESGCGKWLWKSGAGKTSNRQLSQESEIEGLNLIKAAYRLRCRDE